MSTETHDRSERRRTMWLGCAMLALITIIGALVQKTAGASAAAAACVYGGGVLAMAMLTARSTAFPRWAWFAAAGVLMLTLVVAALCFTAPAQVKEWTSMAWMLPWLFLVSTISPAPETGRCSPRGAWSGPLLVGMSVLFSSILLAVWWLPG